MLDKTFGNELAAARCDFMSLPRPPNHSAPTLGYQFCFHPLSLQVIRKSTIHPRNREPKPGIIKFEEWLQFRKPQAVFLQVILRPLAYDGVEL